MAEVATAYVSLLASAKDFGPSLSKQIGPDMDRAGKAGGESAGKQFGSSFMGPLKGIAAPLAAAFAGTKVIDFFKGAVGAASDLSETVNKSTVIFGQSSGQIMKWASGSATNFGLSKAAALEAASGFGNMFQQLGFTNSAATTASTSTVKLAADLGSFNNLETSDVLDKISGAMRGEYDSLQALIPNLNAARVETEALAMTGKTAASELTAQEKATATLAIIQKDGAAAAGDFAETSDGLANSQKILSAQFEDVKSKVGEGLLPALTGLTGFVSTSLLPGLEDVGAAVKDRFGPAFSTVAESVRGVLPSVQGAWDSVKAVFSTFDVSIDWAGVATTLTQGVGGVAQPIIDGFKTGLQTGDYSGLGTALGDGLRTALSSAGSIATDLFTFLSTQIGSVDWPTLALKLGEQVPAILLGFAIGLLNFDIGAVFNTVMDNWFPLLLGALGLLFAPVKLLAPLGKILSKIPFVGTFLDNALKWVSDLGTTITDDFLSPVWNRFIAGFKDAVPGVAAGFKGFLDNILVPLYVWADDVLTYLRAIPGRVFEALAGLAEAVGNRLGQMFTFAQGLVREAFEWVSTKLGEFAGFLAGKWSEIATAAKSAWALLKSYVVTPVQEAVTGVANTLTSLSSKVTGPIGDALAAARNKAGEFLAVGKAIIDGIVNGVKNGASALVDAVKGAADRALKAAKSALGIASPSKVFDQEVGQMVGAGMARGINRSAGLVDDAVSSLVPVPRIGSGVASGPAGYSAGAAGGGAIYVQNPFTGEYLLARVSTVADGRIGVDHGRALVRQRQGAFA